MNFNCIKNLISYKIKLSGYDTITTYYGLIPDENILLQFKTKKLFLLKNMYKIKVYVSYNPFIIEKNGHCINCNNNPDIKYKLLYSINCHVSEISNFKKLIEQDFKLHNKHDNYTNILNY